MDFHQLVVGVRKQLIFNKLFGLLFHQRAYAEPLILENATMKQFLYKDQCIQERLIPILKKYQHNKNYMFWPDCASSHYANSVTKFLNEKKIQYVDRDRNPASLPKCRSIENFWFDLKAKVYEKNWETASTSLLQK